MTHTPGPWKVGARHFSEIVSVSEVEFTSPRVRTATEIEEDIKFYGGYLVAESVFKKENAHLIAAAPELYESLWSLLEWYDDGVATFEPDSPPELAAIWKKAKVALAKANGGIL